MHDKVNKSTAFDIAIQRQRENITHTLDNGNLVEEIRKIHMKCDELYVYCNDKDKSLVEHVLAKYPFEVHFNVTDLNQLQGKTLVHYKSGRLSDEVAAMLVLATKYGAYVEPLVSYLDRRYGRTEVELLHSGYFLHMKSFSILSRPSNRIIKRILDLLSAVTLSLIAIPVGLLAALAIKLESPGPIFYRQARVGQFNREFDVIKFRSMRNDAEKNGAQWASKNDARVTRVGRFIRKTRIDELPQLINVFKGEMSLVGPRPEREVFIKELEAVIPYYRFRHAVKPGITGLAQVKYPYGASIEDAVWKHKYDIFYIKHQSLMLDIKILLLTVKTVLFGMGR
ncbi:MULTISPECIES: exopolysaccharide biosynthesis polyprenyl glycosylphosphotransferase [Enterobacteriaceae]|uniref:exopolysaccharide biosynthesis polyprenyl glycosylphosphotransferase n=1 Tax=Enterobacteriaceae TaxID=543 RepID=UPI001980765D|nr:MULTISPECIES: exopolysaccharide biosynthesis polyprenyl glycosylphosphotransferase [Enterobacteriaceae]QSF74418.1 exopolysaccharide biosynthesis polyprenyl glycosylphosphotransferase [Escherichia coli]HCW2765245.1 exopolysaccharide biosynthesis polyprenyl glycosylphosphotransferase [Escherichia coli]